MAETIIVAVISFAGTLCGVYFANRKSTALIAYRMEQLEKKVDKHNTVVERTYKLEESTSILSEKMTVANRRIDDLERSKQ
jgi:MFS superfamily sulfate permease-like transporter